MVDSLSGNYNIQTIRFKQISNLKYQFGCGQPGQQRSNFDVAPSETSLVGNSGGEENFRSWDYHQYIVFPKLGTQSIFIFVHLNHQHLEDVKYPLQAA